MLSKISEATFITLMEKKEMERQAKQVRFDEIQARLGAIQEKILSASKWAEVIRRHMALNDLSRADIDELIDRIEIGEAEGEGRGLNRRQEVRIYWRFVGCLAG